MLNDMELVFTGDQKKHHLLKKKKYLYFNHGRKELPSVYNIMHVLKLNRFKDSCYKQNSFMHQHNI